jgi:hypothetical protein
MSTTTHRRRPHRRATPGGAGAGREAGNAHFGESGEAIAYLDALAAHMHAGGWTAYINSPVGRMATLFVQDPFNLTAQADIIAAPDGAADNWWYWFSWAERIAPGQALSAAAGTIIGTFERPADGP